MEHTTIELLPTSTQYAPTGMPSSRCAARAAGTAQLEVMRLGDVVVKVDVDDLVGPDGRGCHVSAGPLAAGGYGVAARRRRLVGADGR